VTPNWTASSPVTAVAMLERGVSGTRHYGPHGEARREDIEVFRRVLRLAAEVDRLWGR